MTRNPARLGLAAATTALLLGGCVAAVPALYAGSIALSKREQAARANRPAAPAAEETRETASAGANPRLTVLPTRTLPPPSPGAGPQGALWDDFYGHALAAAERDEIADGRKSALLSTPGSLTPTTADCGIQPPAVAIDLDPAGGLFESARTLAEPRLAQVLAALRSRGVEVFWISANFADSAPSIRQALRASGLDSEGRDGIVLFRYPDDRKQDRRASLAETHCVVAIAGDERADFDELYEYLKDPSAAVGLEPLIGDVWFLTPNPLN